MTADSTALPVAPPALPADDGKRLQAIEGCELVDLLLPDMNGLLRGKRVTFDALEKVYRDGVCLPMSLIATDIGGNTVEETGLGYDIGDEDRICRPVPGSLRGVPWSPRPMAQLLLSMEDAGGGMFEANPREALRRVLTRYAARGLKPVVAIELEFYLLDRLPDPRGRPRTSLNPSTGTRNASTQVYYMEDLNDYRGFTDAVADACRRRRYRPTPRWPSTRPGSSRSTSSTATMHCWPATTPSTSSARSRRWPSGRACRPASWPSHSWSRPAAGCTSMSACSTPTAAMSSPPRPRRPPTR
jgi:hypothetical protein